MNGNRRVQVGEEARIRKAYSRRIENDRYSWDDPHYRWTMGRLERRLLRMLNRRIQPLASARVLEVGCGTGHWLGRLTEWGANPRNLTGIDLLHDRLRLARRSCPPGVSLVSGTLASLPFRSDSFDVVLQLTVFTSILDEEYRRQGAREVLRVLQPKGVVVWYDFAVNNPRNPDVRGVRRREIERLFPSCRISLQRTTLAPPIGRALARYSTTVCEVLEMFAPLRTHYLGTISKP